MVSFESDYNNGAHPEILRNFIETNDVQSTSYGCDVWSESARIKIRESINCPNADIYFLAGGTQTNSTVIDAMLAPYEGVIAAESAHINIHESGAIEAFGHKIITLPSYNGKIDSQELRNYLKTFYNNPTRDHMVFPGMVYITFPTELGTIYKANEIDCIFNICKEYDIPLYIDGARLGYGIMSDECDFSLQWLAQHCDVFYIGGTKVGALCGEAVIFPKKNAPQHFFTTIKRHGALLAKSRIVGIQFDTLFTNDLYFNISKYAIKKAMQLRQLFINEGFKITDSPTNQQFVILNNSQIKKLSSTIAFEVWEPINDNETLCRFVCSWATTDNDIEHLKYALQNCSTLI